MSSKRITVSSVRVALLAFVSVLILPTAAHAASPSDARATFYSGNATTCAEVGAGSATQMGFEGSSSASDANVSGVVKPNAGSVQPGNGTELNVHLLASDVVVSAVVLKANGGYNAYKDLQYLPPALQPDQHYIPPLNNGGAVPDISHWFVCYTKATEVPASAIGIMGASALLGTFLGAGIWRTRRRRPA